MTSSWASRSMPSATTLRPMERARATIRPANSAPSGLWSTSAVKVRSILMRSNGIVRTRRSDDQPVPKSSRARLMPRRRRSLRRWSDEVLVGAEDVLGELDGDPGGVEAAALEVALDDVEQVVGEQLGDREVDRHRGQRPVGERRPADGLLEGDAEGAQRDGGHEPGVLGDLEELARRVDLAVGAAPAQERLVADDVARRAARRSAGTRPRAHRCRGRRAGRSRPGCGGRPGGGSRGRRRPRGPGRGAWPRTWRGRRRRSRSRGRPRSGRWPGRPRHRCRRRPAARCRPGPGSRRGPRRGAGRRGGRPPRRRRPRARGTARRTRRHRSGRRRRRRARCGAGRRRPRRARRRRWSGRRRR